MKYILVCLPLLLWSCQKAAPAEKAEAPAAAEAAGDPSEVTLTEAQLQNAQLQIGKPQLRAVHHMPRVNGVVDVPPQNLVSVSFPMGGFLKSTQLLPGMKVRKGQAIATVEDQAFIQLQQDYHVSKSKLTYLQQEFERQRQLNATKAVSDKVYQQARSAYEAERVTVSALAEKLRLININPARLTGSSISRSVSVYSPINGYVSGVKANIGKYINPTDVLFVLVNPEDLHLALTVFEKDLPLLQPGQKVSAHLANNPQKTYEAEILIVSKNVEANRGAIVHCHFLSSTDDLLPGMFMNAEVQVTAPETIAVPEEAVVRYQSGQYVFVAEGPRQFRMMEVKPGTTDEGWVALPEADKNFATQALVTKNAYVLLGKLKNAAEEE